MSFEKNESDMKNMFAREQVARSNYSHKIRMNEQTSTDFYEDKTDSV